MMLLITCLTVIVIVLVERALTQRVEEQLQQAFRNELANVHRTQELRQAALFERVRTLVRRARIHAAIEDDALDLLYPSARDELRDVMDVAPDVPPSPPEAHSLRAQFYRFLDRNGELIVPVRPHGAGDLTPGEESRLRLPKPPAFSVEIGYLLRDGAPESPPITEILATPIISFEHGSAIAALVLGFDASALTQPVAPEELKRGIWLDSSLHMGAVSEAQRFALAAAIRRGSGADTFPESGMRLMLAGDPHLVFVKQLNPGSLYPPAYDVYAYPLATLIVQKWRVRWQVIGVGALLLAAGFILSHVLSRRLSLPVERLADDSMQNQLQRERAETELRTTHAELQRAARFSADASHQLKTPVAVLRAGLEELRQGEGISPETAEEIASLIHQTYRLSGVIDDLLLLSRMDAGRLELTFRTLDVSEVIDGALDDLGAQPGADSLTLSTEYNPGLWVSGDKVYIALILQNLLDNARKYNRPGGRIQVSARRAGSEIRIRIGNNGHHISEEGVRHIFERFHRAAIGENIPGYGLGLNLARELARLHHGELLLVGSTEDWTEFEVCFQACLPPTDPASPA